MKKEHKAAQDFINLKKQHNQESLSGPGSHHKNTKNTTQTIQTILNKYQPKTTLDLGCGDWNWAQKINWNNTQYQGWDAHQELINTLNTQHGTKNITFHNKNINPQENPYPQTDLIIIRDVLFHLPIPLTQNILTEALNKSKYLLTTTTNTQTNTGPKNYNNIKNWGFYHINTNTEPFNLKTRLITQYQENEPNKYLALYRGSRNSHYSNQK